ncbi:MAG: hypothetical protein J6R25_00785 [Bacteroidales bacterium]|nr:hypothetical protein [Bacteroidales bacterium]
MRANEIQWNRLDNFVFNANTYGHRQHYKYLMRLGRCLPNTKAQAEYFISKGIHIDVLNNMDVEIIEGILNEVGFTGDYRYTKK